MKKGFTLIELLAVIVILAVIALIATPIIINIIEDTQKNAALQSANGYVRAVNYKIANSLLNSVETLDGDYIIGENELAVNATNVDGIEGEYTILNNRVLFAGLCVNNYSIEYNATTGKTVFSTASNYCTGEVLPEFEEPEGEYVSAACTDSTKYTNTTNFKIKTVEDLVCLSNLVNGGSNFSGKTVYLVSDIDFNSDDSYSNPSTTSYGDINGDSSTDGLKTEVTTGKGFKPIGNTTTKFRGTFEGYAFTISNLTINRPSESNVGLFSFNEGTINGIRLRGLSVTGGSVTGGLVGHNTRAVTNIDARGSVTGADNVGGISGKSQYVTGNISKDEGLVFSGSVTGTNSVGGILGWSYSASVKAVTYNSTIEATSGTNVGAIIGYVSGLSSGNKKSSNVTLTLTGNQSSSASNGTVYNKLRLHNIDDTIDTYIGGDNDAATPDGYYYDYDSDYNLILYSVVRNPIQIGKLKGSGTEESPYLINSIKDWKMATSTIGGTTKYYSITNNLDFNNDYYYALGTSTNSFNGILDGGLKTISNVNIENDNSASIFGYNTGTIKDIKLNNITIVGKSNTGTIVGQNNGTINGIIARNITVSGGENTGGIAGYNPRVIINVDVRGTITSTSSNVGGISGKSQYVTGNLSKDEEMVFSGTVTGTNSVGGLIGWSYSASVKGIVYDSTITATDGNAAGKIIGYVSGHSGGNKRTSNVTLSYTGTQSSSVSNGDSYAALRLHNIDDAVDTYIGGAEDDNYYFDYDSNNKIVLYNITETPINNTLSGTGTSEDPYIISSLSDWRIATSTLNNTAKYYSITSNLDFNNDYMYALGTSTHKFNGNINGNMNTLSNITIVGGSYTGIFGFNTGTIQGIKVNNASITGGSNTGLIVGQNNGTITGITGRSITVTGGENTGGLVGYNPRAITNIDMQGTITSESNNVGGISGKSQYVTGNLSKDEDLVFKGTVTGNNSVGGLIGYSESASVKGVVYNSTITAIDGSAAGNMIGYVNRHSSGNKKYTNVTLSYTGTQSSSASNGTEFTGITTANVADTIDTADSTNSDGYYFTVTNGEYTLTTSN